MAKIKFILIAAIVIAGAVATLMIHQRAQTKSHLFELSLQEDDEQLAALTAENQRLSNLVASASAAPPVDHTAELTKLRSEAEALKKQTNDLAAQLAANRETQPTPLTPAPVIHPPEYWRQMNQMAGTKSIEARDLALEFSRYAWDHQGQCPTNLDQLTSSLVKDHRTLSGTNQFEIIYHGSFDDLKGIPVTEVAVMREQQAWPGPDGRMVRVYGMGGGAGQIVTSDDNFVSWEAKHVILPPKN